MSMSTLLGRVTAYYGAACLACLVGTEDAFLPTKERREQMAGYRPCLGACIFDQSGRILVGKRSAAKKKDAGTVTPHFALCNLLGDAHWH